MLTDVRYCDGPVDQAPILSRPREQGNRRPPHAHQDLGGGRPLLQPAPYRAVLEIQSKSAADLALELVAKRDEERDPEIDRKG